MAEALDREERDAAIAGAGSISALREIASGCRACEPAIGTIHPSAVLRAPDDTRDEMLGQLIGDLRVAATRLA